MLSHLHSLCVHSIFLIWNVSVCKICKLSSRNGTCRKPCAWILFHSTSPCLPPFTTNPSKLETYLLFSKTTHPQRCTFPFSLYLQTPWRNSPHTASLSQHFSLHFRLTPSSHHLPTVTHVFVIKICSCGCPLIISVDFVKH